MSDEQAQQIQEAFREFGRAAVAAFEAVVEALRPVIEAIMEAAREIYQWVTDRYNEAGAPYGTTHDGLIQWWYELLEIERLRRETETIQERHRFLAELRTWRLPSLS